MTFEAENLFYALTAGILPAIVWLAFWLQEDRKRPEPRGLIMMTFVAGMLMVPFVIPFQKLTYNVDSQTVTFIWWAALEEIFKFGAAFAVALRRREMNEPVDALIYMMTAALGFVAIENTLFILSPLLKGNITESIITGNLRFIGASLLHTISSAAVGIAMALTFYRSKSSKLFGIFAGLFVAILLHAIFNLLIIKETHPITFATFGFVWIGVVVLMLLFERVKKIYAVNKI